MSLGESGHGVAEFEMAKVRLIKYMHEKLGYDVIAFESSTFECERAQRKSDSLTARQLMQACIFPVWHTNEVLPLFEYIKQTHSTPHPLILAGFDEQVSSTTVNARPALFRDLILPINPTYAQHVVEWDSLLNTRYRLAVNKAALVEKKDAYIAFYDSLAKFLRTNRAAIEKAHRDDPNVAVIARQAAMSMTFFVRQISVGANEEGTTIRDLGMADNLDFLLKELYPKKSFMLWAHNFYIQHRLSRDLKTPEPRTMGTWVVERHRPELYTLGLFMYRGSAASNDRSPYEVKRSSRGSLESIMHQAPFRYSFVDFSRARRTPGTDWMWTRTSAMSWGTTIESMIPRDEYDGVLFIDTTHPPNYVSN